jgi:hypothetical protein
MPDEMSIEEMIREIERSLEQMAEAARNLDKLKAALAAGERLPPSPNVPSWPELRERMARLIEPRIQADGDPEQLP